jgi:hypothetical protein
MIRIVTDPGEISYARWMVQRFDERLGLNHVSLAPSLEIVPRQMKNGSDAASFAGHPELILSSLGSGLWFPGGRS